MTTKLGKEHSPLTLAVVSALAAVLGFVVLRSGRTASTGIAAALKTQTKVEPDLLLRAESANQDVSPVDASRQLLADIPRLSRAELRRLHRRLQLEGDPGYALAQAVAAMELRRETINRTWIWEDNSLAHTDPDKAWALAWEATPDYRRGEWLRMVLEAISNAHGAETALQYLGRIDDADLRHSLAGEIVMEAASTNPELAARLCEEYPEWRGSIMMKALGTIATSDPKRALDLANQLPPAERPMATDVVLEGWLQSDADSALAWIEAQSDAPFHPNGHALGNLMATDPVMALGFAQRTGTRTEQLELLNRILHEAMTAKEGKGENGEVVAKWMRENLNTTEIANVVSEGAQFYGNDPPMWQRDLVARALEQMDDVSGSDRISRMVQGWSDFDAKRAWVEALPDVPRRKMSGVLLPEWSGRNSHQAAEFLREIPTAEGRALVLRTGLEAAADKTAFARWAVAATGGDAVTRALVPELKTLGGEAAR